MTRKRKVKLDPSKFLSPVKIRVNLVLASLYISGYEILKTSIIESVKNTVVARVDGEVREDLLSYQSEIGGTAYGHVLGRPGAAQPSQPAIAAYEGTLGIRYDVRDETGLMPSCLWLERQGVFDQDAVQLVRQIRQHRNEISHELPSILVGQGYELKLEHLEDMEQILNHVEIWRFHEAFTNDPRMQEYVEDEGLILDQVRPGRVVVFDVLMSSVRGFLEEIEKDLAKGG